MSMANAPPGPARTAPRFGVPSKATVALGKGCADPAYVNMRSGGLAATYRNSVPSATGATPRTVTLTWWSLLTSLAPRIWVGVTFAHSARFFDPLYSTRAHLAQEGMRHETGETCHMRHTGGYET